VSKVLHLLPGDLAQPFRLGAQAFGLRPRLLRDGVPLPNSLGIPFVVLGLAHRDVFLLPGLPLV